MRLHAVGRDFIPIYLHVFVEPHGYPARSPLPIRQEELHCHLYRCVSKPSFEFMRFGPLIVANSGQVRGAATTTEPLYIQFEDDDTANTWLALLRSYAMPEVYGRWLSPEDGGLYRMWRQVDLTCLQGRNLGVTRPLSDDPSGAEQDTKGEGDAIDMDVYCEIFVNGTICGRTTVKKGIGSPDWHERFQLTDLPPFENLEIVVWREKRLTRPSVIGSVVIVLVNFRRGDSVEGWFPVLNGGQASSTQAGEMRLKIRVDECVPTPHPVIQNGPD